MSATTTGSTMTASRQFWTYWSASATSSVGTAITAVALPLTAVLVLHAAPLEMGLLAAAGYVAWLLIGLPAGAIVQRLPLRGSQVAMDLVRAAAVASIPAAWWLGLLSVAQLVVVALAISFADVIFFVASSTFLPRVVAKDQLQVRNSLMSGTDAASQLGGPSLGGVLVQLLGAVPTMLVDVASYLVSAVLLRGLPEVEQPRERGPVPVRRQIREGWQFVTRHHVLAPCLWVATAINFVCGGQLALFAVYLVRDLHAPAALVGLLLSAEGVGSLSGAAVTPRITRSIGTARACVAAGVVTVGGAWLIPVGDGWPGCLAFAGGTMLFAGGVVVISTTTRTYRQVASPPELLSRVMATVRFVSWGAIPFGSLIGGAVAGGLGARGALFCFAAFSVLSPLVLVLSPIRTMRDLPADP